MKIAVISKAKINELIIFHFLLCFFLSFKLHFNPLHTVEFITLLLADDDDDNDADDDDDEEDEKYKISYSTGELL